MRFSDYSFGSIRVDEAAYDRDIVVDRGEVRARKKGPSKALRAEYGHTPLSAAEESAPAPPARFRSFQRSWRKRVVARSTSSWFPRQTPSGSSTRRRSTRTPSST